MAFRLIFATGNANKVAEVSRMLNGLYEVKTMAEMGFTDDIPEPYPTLHENAATKARTLWQAFRTPCFGEDTGLEIDALDGEPGVRSARYAGDEQNAERNIQLVLQKMQNMTNRAARFRTVMALILDGSTLYFEGSVEGTIAHKATGEKGFGYDPIFMPKGFEVSFAQMNAEEKNAISHRGQALNQMCSFLKNNPLVVENER